MKIRILIICIILITSSLSAKTDVDLIKIHYFIQIKDYLKASTLIHDISLDNKTDQEKAVYFNTKGFIYYKLKNPDQALKNYSLAVKYNPHLYYVYNNIGIIFYQQKNYKKAKTFFLSARKYKDDSAKILVNLALTDFYLRNYDQSFNWVQKALQCDQEYIKKRFDEKKAFNQITQLIKQYPEDKELQKIYQWAKKNKKLLKSYSN